MLLHPSIYGLIVGTGFDHHGLWVGLRRGGPVLARHCGLAGKNVDRLEESRSDFSPTDQ
jgi:hypothetical protein